MVYADSVGVVWGCGSRGQGAGVEAACANLGQIDKLAVDGSGGGSHLIQEINNHGETRRSPEPGRCQSKYCELLGRWMSCSGGGGRGRGGGGKVEGEDREERIVEG